jgi:hypothetical protein
VDSGGAHHGANGFRRQRAGLEPPAAYARHTLLFAAGEQLAVPHKGGSCMAPGAGDPDDDRKGAAADPRSPAPVESSGPWASENLPGACPRAHRLSAGRQRLREAHRRQAEGLKHARLDNSYEAELRKFVPVDLLILDDFATDVLGSLESRDFYDLLLERYRTGSVIVTSKQRP